jgi:hypothetical protein
MKWNDPRIRALLLGRRAIRVVPFPGSFSEEGDEPLLVGVRVLLESEIDQCRLDAIEYANAKAKRLKLSPAEMLAIDSEIVDREVQRAIVFRAFLDAETVGQGGDEFSDSEKRSGGAKGPAPFFPALQAVRQLDAVMLLALSTLYLEHVEYVNPYRSLSEAEVEELADALSKGQQAPAMWERFDSDSLRRLLRSLVSRLVK